MVDYVRLSETAQRLIEKNGRDFTFTRITDGAPADPNKPWNPGTPTEDQFTVKATLFDNERSLVTGELVKENESLLLVADDSLVDQGFPTPPNTKDVVESDGDTWRVEMVDILKPGDKAVIYELRLVA